MTRFAWLQSRTQTYWVGAALGALAIVAAITGVHLSHIYHNLVSPCAANGNCGLAIGEFANHYGFLQSALNFLLRLAPGIIGVFWGGPIIARELESGTYRLAWTQTVSRSRWIVTKLAIVGGTAVAAAGLLTLTITWWYRALDSVGGNMYGVFDSRDVVPMGYTFFAFMLGAVLGAIIRRSLPAMAATLGTFAFVRVAIQLWVRPHLLPPLHKTMSLLDSKDFGFFVTGGSPVLVVRGSSPPGSLFLSSQMVLNGSTHAASMAERAAFVHQHCPNIGLPPLGAAGQPVQAPPDVTTAFNACQAQAAKAFHLLVTYQPASHYWTFQWLELGIFVVLGLIAAAMCYWVVTRRVR